MTVARGNSSSYSLRGRLLLWLLVPLMLIGLIALYDGYRAARTTADEVSDRVLTGSALAIAERVFVNDEGLLEVDIPYVALQMLTSSEDDRVFYRIEDGDGQFITGYRKLELPKAPPPTPDSLQFTNGTFRGDAIRIATYSSAASSSTKSLGFRVGIAETTNARNAIAQDILIRSALRQAALIFTAALVVWFAVTRALGPLHRLESAVARRSPDDVRPIEHRVPSEVRGLVQTINELMGRFASSISALRRFTSNTSHQFRTPLALIKTHLEVAGRESDPKLKQEAIDNANHAVGDAERLMAQMLLLARIDATSRAEMSAETCELSAIARGVCEDFVLQLSNAGRTAIDLGFHAEQDVWIKGEKTLVQEVVRNLIDNSIKHGEAGSGQSTLHIDVSVAAVDGHGDIVVEDNGPGFAWQETTQSAQASGAGPALQGTQSRHGGSGIGLTIVREILHLLSARIRFVGNGNGNGNMAAPRNINAFDSTPGGTRATVSFLLHS